MAALPAGAMAALPLPAGGAGGPACGWPGRLSVAAVNGPAADRGLRGPRPRSPRWPPAARGRGPGPGIPVGYASHTAQVEAIRAGLLHDLAGVAPRATGHRVGRR